MNSSAGARQNSASLIRRPTKVQIGDEVAKQIKKQRKKKTKQALSQTPLSQQGGLSKQSNPYLQTLIDPERFGDVRYPDAYPRLTGMVQALVNDDVFVFGTPADQAVNPASEVAGTYLNVFSPVLVDPILEYRDEAVAGSVLCQTILTTQSDRWGLFPLTEDQITAATDSDQMFFMAPGEVNIKAPITWSDQDFAAPPFRGVDQDGNVFYGQPFRTTVGTATSLHVDLEANVATGAPGTQLFADIVTINGVVSKAFTVTAITGSRYNHCTVDFSALELNPIMVVGSNSQVAGMPGMGVRLRSPTGGLGAILARAIRVIWTRGSGLGLLNPRLVSVKLPDEDTYTKKIDQYRIVSASVWLQYQGATLTNGGQSAAIVYRGGTSAFENGLWDYDLVAETPGGYQGALMTGTYSFWFPSNEKDMLLRGISSGDRWDFPYIVNVGRVSSPDIPHTLRIRIPVNIELVSTSQVFQYRHADINPMWIAHAASVVATMQTSMENPLHWETIKKVLGEAADTALDIGKWFKKNWGVIGPAAALVGSLL